MADLSLLTPEEYPSDEQFMALCDRLEKAGLVMQHGPGKHDPISPTPEGYTALGLLLALVLSTHEDRERLKQFKAERLFQALVSIGERSRLARPDDGQHR